MELPPLFMNMMKINVITNVQKVQKNREIQEHNLKKRVKNRDRKYDRKNQKANENTINYWHYRRIFPVVEA